MALRQLVVLAVVVPLAAIVAAIGLAAPWAAGIAFVTVAASAIFFGIAFAFELDSASTERASIARVERLHVPEAPETAQTEEAAEQRDREGRPLR